MQPKEPGLCGLKRLSNTCYMNSFLQALGNTSIFRSYLFQNQDKFTEEDHKITYHLLRLFKLMWSGQTDQVLPFEFKKAVDSLTSFYGFDQQDCPDFANFILDKVHEELKQKTEIRINADSLPESIKIFNSFCKSCLKIANDPATPQAEKDKYLKEYDEYKKFHKKEFIFKEALVYWKKYLEKEYSIISRTFMGLMSSEIQCDECQTFRANMEPFYILQVCIPDTEEELDLYDCISHTFQYEKMEGDDAYSCEHCKDKKPATIKRDICIYPHILALHIKQFHNNRRKLSKDFKIPMNDLKLYNNLTGQSYTYRLFGAIKHFGKMFSGMSFGHYIAFAENCVNKKWYAFNDTKIQEITVDAPSIINDEPYFLFFELVQE